MENTIFQLDVNLSRSVCPTLESRVAGNDWTISWEGRCFQILPEEEHLALAKKKIIVRRLRSGAVRLVYQGKLLRCKELAEKPLKPKPEPRKVGRTKLVKPGENQPWKQNMLAVGKEFWRKAKAERDGGKARAISPRRRFRFAVASASPSLRSGSATEAAG